MRLILVGCVSLLLASCAHAPKKLELAPEALLDAACAPSARVKGVEGSVWMSAKSPDASGKFPAQVSVKDGGPLLLEVTNLLGGTEAVIRVDGQKYEIQLPEKKKPKAPQEGFGSWGGIPLTWASTLFLGRIPCPSEVERKQAKLSTTPDQKLRVEVPGSIDGGGQIYVFGFREWIGKPWPETLEWERLGALGGKVSFGFDDPEDRTAAPRKWEAKSDRGEVKVRWRDRSVN